MKKRKLNDIYLGMLTKNEHFESYTEKQLRSLGGYSGTSYFYHHRAVFAKLSPLEDWENEYAKESTLRFIRKGRVAHIMERGDNFHLFGESALKPYSKKSRKQIGELAKILIKMGISPDLYFAIPLFRLPEEVAPYQGKEIGTLGEFAKGRDE